MREAQKMHIIANGIINLSGIIHEVNFLIIKFLENLPQPKKVNRVWLLSSSLSRRDSNENTGLYVLSLVGAEWGNSHLFC